jgi:hypothetical protein
VVLYPSVLTRACAGATELPLREARSAMVEVGRFDARTDAEVARSLLAAAGIPCVLAPDEAAGGARVLVAEADADEAAAILRGAA